MRITELNPSGFMLSRNCDKATYLSGYANILQRAEAAGVFSRLLELAKSQNIVLLCWEHDNQNCHRRLIADWLHEKHGMEVRECSPNAPIRKENQQEKAASDRELEFG